jgi:hypothetical protein
MRIGTVVLLLIILLIIGSLSGCTDTASDNNTQDSNGTSSSVSIDPDSSSSPIQKYFTTQKIIWTFDDYWIYLDYHPPHKGFDGLSQRIHSYGGYVNIMCPFLPDWINKNYGYEVRNYSVVEEFSPYHTGFSQNHINLSLEFFNRDYISVGAHSWNHSENLATANLSYAYKIINYTLWNWYNNYQIQPHFWLGHNTDGNYNISVALKKFSETYWPVYSEAFRASWKDRFPPGKPPAVEYLGADFDPYFGVSFGHPCKTLEEAQQLYNEYAEGRDIIFIRGHPGVLNQTIQQNNLTLWQEFIDWMYQDHTFINMKHTQVMEYKIDRNNFSVVKNNAENYTIDLTKCEFNHTVLFSLPEGKSGRWVLNSENGEYIGEITGDTYLPLERGQTYFFTRV